MSCVTVTKNDYYFKLFTYIINITFLNMVKTNWDSLLQLVICCLTLAHNNESGESSVIEI